MNLSRSSLDFLSIPAHLWLESGWWRWLAPVAVVLLSGALGYRADPRFLLLVPGLVALLVLIKWPQLGLLGLVVGAMVVPLEIGTGTDSSVNTPMLLVAALVGVWVLEVITRQRETRPMNGKVLLPLILLMLSALVSVVVGQVNWFRETSEASLAAQLGGSALFLFSGLTLFWVGQLVRDVRWIKYTLWLFLGLSGLFMAARILPGADIVTGRFERGVVAGSLFYTWTIALAFGQFMLNSKLNWPMRFLCLGIVGATFYVTYVITGDWKSGWVPGAAAVGVMVGLRWPRLGIAFLLLGFAPLVNVGAQLIESDAYSYSTRIDAWLIMLEIIKENPLLGLGPSNYYFYTQLFPIRGYYVTFNSHNQYLDLLAQVGLVGAVFYLWFFVAMARLCWRMLSRVAEGFEKGYVYGVLGGVAATVLAGGLGDWVIPFVYNVGFPGFRASVLAWVFMGGALALEQIVRLRSVSEEIG